MSFHRSYTAQQSYSSVTPKSGGGLKQIKLTEIPSAVSLPARTRNHTGRASKKELMAEAGGHGQPGDPILEKQSAQV